MEIAAIVKLAGILGKWFIKAYAELGKKLDERKVEQELNESLKEAQKAFEGCLPQKSDVAYSTILGEFFSSNVLEFQCQRVLKGGEYDPKPLVEVFNQEYSRYYSGRAPDFNALQAIRTFFDKFIKSIGRSDCYVHIEDFRLRLQNLRREYRDQLVAAYENLSFAGVSCAYDQNPIKIRDIFITLQASRRVPVVDVLAEAAERLEPEDERRLPRDVRIRESVEELSVVEALRDNHRMVVLGAPGSGKTTFMRYLALTFARKLSGDRLKLDEDRLPILITVQNIVDDLLKDDKTIADVLSKHVNSELQMDLPDDYFTSYLEKGECIVLFDGLDEVADVTQRGQVAEKVRRFANRYNENRYMVTSRIAGYREIQRLPESDFKHFTIRDFDDDQIRDFARKWYQARYPSETKKRTDDLIQAIGRSAKVRQLAVNPLMLTIIAVVHRSSAELPNERIKLYDLCTEALLFSWQRERGRPSLTDASGSLIRDTEVRRRLEQLAYWMHGQKPKEAGGQMHVRYNQLWSKLAEQLVQRKKMDQDDAEDESKHFLEYIRENTGILLERGTQLYAFVHLTFQEYFAVWEICRRCRGDVEKIWKEISPHLHDGHWREVIILLIAKLDELYPDEIGEELIQKILKADSPREDLLKRDLLLAGACLADDVTAEDATYKGIIDEIINLAMDSFYGLQEQYPAGVLRNILESHYKDYIAGKFLEKLENEDSDVRWKAGYVLGSIGKADDQIIQKLMERLEDRSEDSLVRSSAAYALGGIGKADGAIVQKLMERLEDKSEDSLVRSSVAYALGGIGKADDAIVQKLMKALEDEDSDVRWRAAYALGSIGRSDDAIIQKLMEGLEDRSEDSLVRNSTADALGMIGRVDNAIIQRLMERLEDRDEDSDVRGKAAYALGLIGKIDERIIDKLAQLLSDEPSVRWRAAHVLKRIGETDEYVIGKLAPMLSDRHGRSRMLWEVAHTLGRIGKADRRVIENLLLIRSYPDKSVSVCRRSMEALVNIGKTDKRVVQVLVSILSDPAELPHVRGGAASVLENIGKADERVIEALVSILADPDEDSYVRTRSAFALECIGRVEEYVVDVLVSVLSNPDVDSYVRESTVDVLRGISEADEGVIAKLEAVVLDPDESLYTSGSAAYALINIGIRNGEVKAVVKKVLERICGDREEYEKYDDFVQDPDGCPIFIYDWAFQELLRIRQE